MYKKVYMVKYDSNGNEICKAVHECESRMISAMDLDQAKQYASRNFEIKNGDRILVKAGKHTFLIDNLD